MWLTNIDLNVDLNSIDSRFKFRVDFKYYKEEEAPITFYGFIKSSDGKRIAEISCEDDNYSGERFISIPIEVSQGDTKLKENREVALSRDFSASISLRSLSYLENLRQLSKTKNVRLTIELTVVSIKQEFLHKPTLRIERTPMSRQIEIEQSDWLKNYAPIFGIGEFLIIEFSKQNIITNNDFRKGWFEKIERSKKRLNEMENHLLEGKWDKVIEDSRKIWDIFKVYDANKKMRQEFSELFETNNYSDSGQEEFLKSIWHLHEFSSKFVHDKDKRGENLNPIPTPQKEDAYFMYLWSMGFVNLINEKVKGLDQ